MFHQHFVRLNHHAITVRNSHLYTTLYFDVTVGESAALPVKNFPCRVQPRCQILSFWLHSVLYNSPTSRMAEPNDFGWNMAAQEYQCVDSITVTIRR